MTVVVSRKAEHSEVAVCDTAARPHSPLAASSVFFFCSTTRAVTIFLSRGVVGDIDEIFTSSRQAVKQTGAERRRRRTSNLLDSSS